MDSFSESLVDLCDTLVYENKYVYPEDMFFVLRLLEKHYKGIKREQDCTDVCEIAWEIATFTTDYVESKHKFHWINAYAVLSKNYNRKLRNTSSREHDFESVQPHHYSKPEIDYEHHESVEQLMKTVSEITDVIETYRNTLSGKSSGEVEQNEEEIPNVVDITMRMDTLSKRYASRFEYDIKESEFGMELANTILIPYEKSETVADDVLCEAFELVVDWTEQKAKREYSTIE